MITLLWVGPMVAEVNVKLSHSTTSLEQPVRLKLQIEGENDASPDLSVLKQDFEILGRSSSQNISIINGKMSKNQGLTLTLLPKKTGKLTIPPIPVGEESSTPLTLDVVEIMQNSEAADSTSAFILLELNKSQAYLQEEVILTVRVYQAEGIRGEALTEPVTSLPDTVMRLLHEEQYQAEHEGQSYQVIERLYTIYAYQTGKLELGEVRYRGRSGSRPSIFNLMRNPFSDPIQESKIIHATSEHSRSCPPPLITRVNAGCQPVICRSLNGISTVTALSWRVIQPPARSWSLPMVLLHPSCRLLTWLSRRGSSSIQNGRRSRTV